MIWCNLPAGTFLIDSSVLCALSKRILSDLCVSFSLLLSQDLIVDQTIEKVSFCAPDRNYDKAFSYICRDGTTRRWMCHCFMALKDSVRGQLTFHPPLRDFLYIDSRSPDDMSELASVPLSYVIQYCLSFSTSFICLFEKKSNVLQGTMVMTNWPHCSSFY